MPIAKANFDLTMERAFNKIALYERLAKVKLTKEPKRIPEEELSDIVRMALVLGISAFDAYFTDKFIEKFIPYIRSHGPSKDIVAILEKSGFNTEMALELFAQKKSKRPYRTIRNLVKRKLDSQAF